MTFKENYEYIMKQQESMQRSLIDISNALRRIAQEREKLIIENKKLKYENEQLKKKLGGYYDPIRKV